MTNINVKIRKVNADAIVPTYATEGAAAFDLYAAEDVVISPGQTAKVPLGFALELPPGYEMQIRPRSGVTEKTKLRVANSPATIDSDFRGEVAAIFDNIAREERGFTPRLRRLDGKTEHYDGSNYEKFTYWIRKGDRVAQAVIQPVPRVEFTEVARLSETARGSGGFGSSGVRLD